VLESRNGIDAYLAYFHIMEEQRKDNEANWYFGISDSLVDLFQIGGKSPDFRKTVEDFLFKKGTDFS